MVKRHQPFFIKQRMKLLDCPEPQAIFPGDAGTAIEPGSGQGLWKRLPAAGCAAAAIALMCLASPNPAICQTGATTRTVTIPEIRLIEAARAHRTDAQRKISSNLLDAINERRTGSAVSGVPHLRSQPLESAGGNTLVDIDANVDEALLNAIRQAGGTIVNAHPEDHAIRASIPLGRIESIAANARVNFIAPAEKGAPQAIPFDEGGVIGHTADKAREFFHADGSGIKVGILSDSIDDGKGAMEAAFQAGAVDRNLLHVISGQAGEGAGEGLAMAELVHAIAPKADIYFATANGGPAQMAENILRLQEAGCLVIVDDYSYSNDPPFQEGPISRAVSLVTGKGVLYFSSAGNYGSKKHNTSTTWEGDFTEGGAAPGELGGEGAQFHAFVPGTIVNWVTGGSAPWVTLFWADPLRSSSNQYNLYVVTADGHVVKSGTTSHTGSQPPWQYIPEGVKAGEGIVITKSADAAPLFIRLEAPNARLSIGTDGSTRGHNASAARNAFSVAAIPATVPPEAFTSSLFTSVEGFSSDGPRRMFFNPDGSPMTPGIFTSKGGRVFAKPDIVAADGVTTSLPKGGLNPFFGTSAAAPHAAAVAALVLSYDRGLKADDVREILLKTALPIDGGQDGHTAGAGVVTAFAALREACRQRAAQLLCPDASDGTAATSSFGKSDASANPTHPANAKDATDMLLK